MMIPERPRSSGACSRPSTDPQAVGAADPGRPRRLRHRPHVAAAAAARSDRPHRRRSTSTSSGSRRRPSVSCSAARVVAVPGASPRRDAAEPAPATRSTRRWPSLDTARAPGAVPATFLLDEFLELRTFESFPGLRSVLRDLVGALGGERQPLRPDQPLRRARACGCCATRRRVRDHPRRAAQRRRNPRHAARRPRRRSRARPIDDREDEVERQRDELARLVHALVRRASVLRAR